MPSRLMPILKDSDKLADPTADVLGGAGNPHRSRILPMTRQSARCYRNGRPEAPQTSEAQKEARTDPQRTVGKNQPLGNS